LNIYEQIALEDVFAFLVFLRSFIGFVIFPSKCYSTFAAINIAHSVVTSGHRAIARFALKNVHHYFEQISSAMLAVESSGYHRMDGCKVGLAIGTAINAFAGKVTTIGHAHVGVSIVKGANDIGY